MAVLKCKMCGGTLEVVDGSSTAVCEYCGSQQTIPKLTTEKKANLYDRANHFRRNNEFDKAMAIFEQILNEDGTDAEAYWSLVLCKYGVEYVEDPLSRKRIPTINRAQYTSIFEDDNYKMALQYADMYQRHIYEDEARAINEIQKGILEISSKEEPFDVFICYKETDNNGKRTHDSVIANDLYHQLKEEGFKVFFARITLEDKLGTAYEPYIFAALNSAKVMVVLGTKPEFFNAVWVKNEWSRYLSLIKQGQKKMLIPAYKDMDPYDLPTEFSHLQAQDMSKLGFMQDLIRGIKKMLGKNKKTPELVTERVIIKNGEHQDTAPILRRAFLFLEDGNYDSANEYAEKVLDINPECAEAYMVKLLIDLHLRKPTDLANYHTPIAEQPNYMKAVRFATPEYRETVEEYNNAIVKRLDTERKSELYAKGVEFMRSHAYDDAIEYFSRVTTYKDAVQKIDECKQLKESERLADIYGRAGRLLNAGQYDAAIQLFATITDYKDSKEKVELCKEKKEIARKDAIYSRAMERVVSPTATDVQIKQSIEELHTISGYRDVDDKIRRLDARLEKWYEDKRIADEKARIKAEEERRTRERLAEEKRIKQEKTRKKVKKVAIIGLPSIAAFAIIIVLIITLIIPTIQFNKADDLFNQGKYELAMEMYEKLDGFSDSEERIIVLNSIKKIDNADFENAVKNMLAAGVPVKIVYGMEGGDFSGAAYTSIMNTQSGGNIVLCDFSNTVYGSAQMSDSTDSTEFVYENADEFSGLQTPERKGYNFVKWELNAYVYKTGGTFELKLNAVWQKKGYDISYNLNGGTIVGENPIAYDIDDENFTLINPTKTGYTFLGWTGTDLDTATLTVVISKGSVGNREYTANWEANTYTLTFNANGGSVSVKSQSVVFDESYTLPVPTKEGYTFAGWFNDSVEFVDGVWNKVSSYELTAQWEIIKYTIHYNLNGGTNHSSNPAKYTITDTVTLYEPTRTGYTFLGWTFIGQTTPIKSVTIPVGTIGEKSYTANWGANTYTITFNENNGVCDTESMDVIFDDNVTLPTATRTGYTFLGWFNNGKKYDSGVWKTANDITLTANWEANKYNLSFDKNGGVCNTTSQQVTYDQNYTLPTAIRTGYTFLGWFSGEDEYVDGVWKETSGVLLKAKWGANTYTITFDENGGVCDIESKDVVFDETYTLPTPTRAGYTFTGWKYNGSIVNEGTWKIANHCTFIASWSANANTPYTVNHLLQNITDDNYTLDVAQHLTGMSDTSVTPAVKTYIGFTSPASQTVNISPDGSLVVNYYYTRNSYTVSFVMNGGENISTVSRKYQANLDLPNGERDGYTFGGWFLDKELSNEFTGMMPAQNKTVYAWWSEENKPADFKYSGTTAITVSGYTGNDSTLWIPSYIGNIAVTSISASAFVNHSETTKVVVPDSVTSIGSGAFKGCVAIEDITLPFVGANRDSTSTFSYIFTSVPDGLTKVTITDDLTIPSNAFKELSQIESITIPEGVTSIGSYAFYNCDALKRLNSETDGEFNIPVGVSTISTSTFYGCSLVEKVTVGDLTSIESSAFSGCSLLSQFNSANANEIIVPGGVISIGNYAFQDVLLVTKVVVPDSVTSIGSGAFMGCNVLEDITLPFVGGSFASTNSNAVFGYIFGYIRDLASGAINQYPDYYYYIPKSIKNVTVTVQTNIPAYAFKNCDFIESITIPEEVTSIGSYAFYNCDALKRLNSETDGLYNLPTGLTSISDYTFANNSQLEEVTMGSSLTGIGSCAFRGCSLLSQFNSDNANEIIVPGGVTSIGSYAFQNVLLVTKVVVPDSVTSIGVGAFMGCNVLEEIALPFVGGSFASINSNAVFGHIFGYRTSSASGTVNQYSNYYYYIPKSIKNVTVTVQTNIPAYAFKNCDFIETIHLPKYVEIYGSVGSYAFQNCSATILYDVIPEISMPWKGSAATAYNSGSGTKEDPFVIFTPEQFAYFASQVNGGNSYSGVYFKLASDINLNGYALNVIGGSSETPFAGVFDGNGFTISRINISSSGNYVGLFGYCRGTIKNLGLASGTITANSTSDSSVYVGALVGWLSGTIDNCYSNVSVNATLVKDSYVGGLIGANDGLITNSHCGGNVVANYSYAGYAGGFVGLNQKSIKDSYATGNVTCNSANFMAYAGGFVGTSTATIQDCYAAGNVTAKGSAFSYSKNGGFVGDDVDESLIVNCFRASEQVLTQYTTSGSAFNALGTELPLSEIVKIIG